MDNELEIVRQHMGDGPVKVASIFSDLGVDYSEQDIIGGESGWIEVKDNIFTVVVNEKESHQRKRFTAAHELAHYLMHRDILISSGRLNRHTDRLFGEDYKNNRDAPFQQIHEVQANKMAAQIIMPASKIREYWNNLKQRNRALKIEAVADRFEVSKMAMQIRLKTLGLLKG